VLRRLGLSKRLTTILTTTRACVDVALREAMVIVSAGAPARNGAGPSSLDTSA